MGEGNGALLMGGGGEEEEGYLHVELTIAVFPIAVQSEP